MKYIDIHNHSAWEIDDGMPNKEDAVTSLRNAYEDGIREIIATPHFIPGSHDEQDMKAMKERIEELKAIGESIGIEIHRGCELFLNASYLEMLDSEGFLTLANSGYALCEFDVRKDITKNREAEDILYEFEVRDMIPVIAHVERYFPKGIDVTMVRDWHEKGYVIQINRTSLIGTHGEVTKKNAWKLIEEGLAHVVATDTHRAQGHRISKLSDVYEELRKEAGEYNAELLCHGNPERIIRNEVIEDMKIEKKTRWFSKKRRR